MIKRIIILSVWGLCSSLGFGQDSVPSSFTLEECITMAIENNLDLKSAELRKKSSKVNYKQSINELLPNLNANYNIGVNDGRSIDPFTNSYINRELTFSNLGVNLNMTVFNGFRVLNSIKQSKFNLRAAEMEEEGAKQNLILDVTIGYIQILNSRDAFELSKARLKTTEVQLKRLEANYKEGVGNPADYTDMKGQYALDEVAIIDAENNFKSAVLDFIRLLNIEGSSQKQFNNISGLINSEKYQLSANDVYHDALQNLATFKSRQLRIDAANKGIKVARANYLPEVSVFGQLNTNYSSLAETFTETGTAIIETGDFVTINNQDFPVLKNETQFEGKKIDYMDQFDNNLNTVVGISVQMPLFNGFRAKNNVKLQKIQLEESQLELQNTKLLFKQSIQQAHNNMETAYNKYHVLLEQVAAFEESYRVNEVRFNNGVSNIVNYIVSKNNMDNAKLNLSRAKYEYLLRVKVLDFYRGIY
ncbi:TolC family protein [Flavivirga algicola]|uniref:TolC family protein n=1 Tax=Flavivirga algicola TaxID=2729136 RepID=A0ABX1S0Y8_9FLAO|nr:TolC family protein [Flavivirga algicola]NMH88898.1 TolC family protein [Flavivirga algicola]